MAINNEQINVVVDSVSDFVYIQMKLASTFFKDVSDPTYILGYASGLIFAMTEKLALEKNETKFLMAVVYGRISSTDYASEPAKDMLERGVKLIGIAATDGDDDEFYAGQQDGKIDFLEFGSKSKRPPTRLFNRIRN